MTSTPPADDLTHQLRELVRTGRFREALEAYRAAGDGSARADARLLAATAATRLGELELAETLAGDAVRRFAERGDFDGRMRALNLLGVIGFERGRLAEAEGRLTEALSIAYRLEDSLLAARACNNLASVAHLRGRPEEAVGLYRGALLGYQRLPAEQMLSAQAVCLTTPIEVILSRPGHRVPCEACGEEILNEREVVRAGRVLCRTCAGQATYYAPAELVEWPAAARVPEPALAA